MVRFNTAVWVDVYPGVPPEGMNSSLFFHNASFNTSLRPHGGTYVCEKKSNPSNFAMLINTRTFSTSGCNLIDEITVVVSCFHHTTTF